MSIEFKEPNSDQRAMLQTFAEVIAAGFEIIGRFENNSTAMWIAKHLRDAMSEFQGGVLGGTFKMVAPSEPDQATELKDCLEEEKVDG